MNTIKESKRIIHIIEVVAIACVLACEMQGVRRLFKTVLIWIQTRLLCFFVDIDVVGFIVRYRLAIEYLFLGTIFVCILISIFNVLRRYNIDKKTRHAKGSNSFEQHLLDYLNSNNASRVFLLCGPWGSGKTHSLTNFFDKYYSKSNKRIYNISCFGLRNRGELENQINSVIKNDDDSLGTLIISLLNKIPVIGELLHELFRKRYDYKSVKNNTIFVFDDFERIAYNSTHSNNKQNKHNNYGLLYEDFKALSEDAKILYQAIQESSNAIEELVEEKKLEKYISVTGIINEMVECCGHKVIIVCNTDKIGERIVSDVLRSKLNCYEYRMKTTKESIHSLAKETAKRVILEDENKDEVIKSYLTSRGMDLIIQLVQKTNLREYFDYIEAFIITADLFEKDMLNEISMGSILLSIILSRKGSFWSTLKRSGEVIAFCTSLALSDEYRLFDESVSGYWFKGLPRPNNIHEIYKEWADYPYIELEQQLVNGNYNVLLEKEFEMIHLLYYMDKAIDESDYNCKSILKELFSRVVKKYDLSTENGVLKILRDYNSKMSMTSSGINNLLFEAIYAESHVMRIDETVYYASDYNQFIEDRLRE